MDQKDLFVQDGRRVISSNGPVSELGLEALVIPMLPDLGVSLWDKFVSAIVVESQMIGDNIVELGFNNKAKFHEMYSEIHREGKKFLVPPTTAHYIEGHKGKLAKNLIYVCSIDAKEGNPYFDYTILKDSIYNALSLAEQKSLKTVGIPNLMSVLFHNKYTTKQIMEKTAEISQKKIIDAQRYNTSLKEIYILSHPDNYHIKFIPLPTSGKPILN
jgi:hypothetical protein